MYRVNNWERHFEGAKSKTYNNKTSCSLPTKHGLGYRRLIRSKNGPALFGAWCALIQVLSRHPKPRAGYCTDTGCANGVPYTFDDLEMLTDIPAKYFDQMLNICKSQQVGWVSLTKVKDSTGDCQETIVPLNLDSDLDLNSDLEQATCKDVAEFYNLNRGNLSECIKVTDKRASSINKRIEEFGIDVVKKVILKAKESEFIQNGTFCNIDWIFNPTNFVKILEDKYKNKSASNDSTRVIL